MKNEMITYKQVMDQFDKKPLSEKIYHLKGQFLMHIDTVTLAYRKTFLDLPQEDGFRYKETNLSKQQREDAIDALRWFKRDIEECIKHLEE